MSKTIHEWRPLPESALTDFYYPVLQQGSTFYNTKEPGSNLNLLRRLTHHPEPWEKIKSVAAVQCKKDIIVSNFLLAAEPKGGHGSFMVVHELLRRGFSLYVLTYSYTLEKIENEKRNDAAYLKDLFAKSQLFRTKVMREKLAQGQKISQFPINLSDETSFILDHYESEKIKHAWFQDPSGSEKPEAFDYTIPIQPKFLEDLATFEQQVPLEQGRLWLTPLNRELALSAIEKQLTLRVKKMVLDILVLYDLSSDALFTIIPKEVIELELWNCCHPHSLTKLDLSYYPDLKILNVVQRVGLDDYYLKVGSIENLPPSLEKLELKMHSLDKWPDWSRHQQLSEIYIDLGTSALEFPKFPPNIKRLTLTKRSRLGPLSEYPLLQELILEDLDVPAIAQLRLDQCKNLKSLYLESSSNRVVRSESKVVLQGPIHWPPALEKLTITQPAEQIKLPSTLTELRIIIRDTYKDGELELPPPLLNAHITIKKNDVPLIIADKARQLRYLNIQHDQTKELKISGFLQLTQLHTLIASNVLCGRSPTFYNFRGCFTSPFVNLKYLDYRDSLKKFKNLSLPGKLESLVFQGDSHCLDQAMSSCPPTLRNLTLIGRDVTALPSEIRNLQFLHLECTGIRWCDLRAYSELRVLALSQGLHKLEPPPGLIAVNMHLGGDVNALLGKKSQLPHPIALLKPDDYWDNTELPKCEQNQTGHSHKTLLFGVSKEQKDDTLMPPRPGNTDPMINPPRGLSEDTYTDPNTRVRIPYHVYSAKEGKLCSIDPCYYRQQVYNRIQGFDLCPSAWTQKKPDTLKEYEIPSYRRYNSSQLRFMAQNEYYVKRNLKVGSAGTHYIPLATLSARDRMKDGVLPRNSRLLYDPALNQYLLAWTTTQAEEALLEYRFLEEEGPPATETPLTPSLNSELRTKLEALFSAESKTETGSTAFIQLKKALLAVQKKELAVRLDFCNKTLATYCTQFGNKPLKNKSPGWEKLQEILVHAKGSCQDRSAVYVTLCHFLQVPARLLVNPGVHRFAELWINGQWQLKQLGGAEVQISNRHEELQLAEEKTQDAEKKEEKPGSIALKDKKQASSSAQPDISWDPYFAPTHHSPHNYLNLAEVFTALSQLSHPLITMARANQGRDFYAAYTQHLKENKRPQKIVYIESPEDIHALWQLCRIDQGQDRLVEGPLRSLTNEGGTVIINWERFSPTQMATFKTVMDTPPNLLGIPIKTSVHFIHLITHQTHSCSAFFSRIKAFKWPSSIPWPDPHPLSQAINTVEEEKGVERVDLYNNPIRSESRLIGEIVPRKKKPGLKFNPGVLTQMAYSSGSKPKHLELIDAPWGDPRFEAFMTRLSVDRAFWANGQRIELPEHFTWRHRSAPAKTEKNEHITPLTIQEWLTDPKEDEYLLDANRIEGLSQQILLKREKMDAENTRLTLSSAAGYLEQKSTNPKRLLQIGPLSPSQRREIEEVITTPVEWVDLTLPATAPALSLASIQELKAKVFDSKTQGLIVQTPDPDFVAHQVQQDEKNTVCIAIDANTRPSALLEHIQIPQDEKASTLELTYQVQPMLQALQQGKTVILHGELGSDLYQALQSLLAPKAQLKLSTEESPSSFPGRLVVLTKTVPDDAHLIQHSRTQINLPEKALWSAYETSLPGFQKETFDKLKLFYELAKKSPLYGGECATPYLSHTRLQRFMAAIKEPNNDNPIKPWFHHDFSHNSDSYAYLNVMAKLFFGPQDNPTVRLTKLEKLPHNASVWQRLNCLNPAALREVFWGTRTIPDAKLCETLLSGIPEGLEKKLGGWLDQPKNYEELKPHSRPHAKALNRMQRHLQQESVVVLKGPPGSGKTWAAKQYCKKVGSKPYNANDLNELQEWQEAKPEKGKLAVLRVDEAQDGNWESLKPPSPQHQVIFTCNDSPVLQSVLQNAATVYVNHWTFEELQTAIVEPLYRKVTQESKEIPAEHQGILNQLITVYEWVKQAQGGELLTLRDLKHLVMRWLMHLEKNSNPQQAAFDACWQEWGQFFEREKTHQEFRQQLIQHFPGCVIDYSHRRNIKATPHFHPLPEQKDLWAVTIADRELAQWAHSFSADEDDPCVKWGILVTGNSGFGKSEIMRRALGEQHFVQFTPSGNPVEDEKIFLDAYKEGHVVIADELNLYDLPYLKHIMTEKSYKGVSAHPDFFVCATQNDPNMPGRKKLPDALLNRFHLVQVPPYSAPHLVDLVQQSLPQLAPQATAIVEAFLRMARKHDSVNLRRFFLGLEAIRKEQGIDDQPEIKPPTASSLQFFPPPSPAKKPAIPHTAAIIPAMFGLAALTTAGISFAAVLQPSGSSFPHYSRFAADEPIATYAIAGTMVLVALVLCVVSYQNAQKIRECHRERSQEPSPS